MGTALKVSFLRKEAKALTDEVEEQEAEERSRKWYLSYDSSGKPGVVEERTWEVQ